MKTGAAVNGSTKRKMTPKALALVISLSLAVVVVVGISIYSRFFSPVAHPSAPPTPKSNQGSTTPPAPANPNQDKIDYFTQQLENWRFELQRIKDQMASNNDFILRYLDDAIRAAREGISTRPFDDAVSRLAKEDIELEKRSIKVEDNIRFYENTLIDMGVPRENR